METIVGCAAVDVQTIGRAQVFEISHTRVRSGEAATADAASAPLPRFRMLDVRFRTRPVRGCGTGRKARGATSTVGTGVALDGSWAVRYLYWSNPRPVR